MTATDELLVMDGLMDAASFGQRLRELRVAAGLSQLALAKKSGLAQTNISGWEAGRSAPLVTVLPALAAALGCDAADLLGDASADVPSPKVGRPKKPKASDN